MTYTMLDDDHGDEICRLILRIDALLERGWLTRARQHSISRAEILFAIFVLFIYIKIVLLILDCVF